MLFQRRFQVLLKACDLVLTCQIPLHGLRWHPNLVLAVQVFNAPIVKVYYPSSSIRVRWAWVWLLVSCVSCDQVPCLVTHEAQGPVMNPAVLCCAVLSCPVMNTTVVSCPVMNSPVLSCPVVNPVVVSCPVFLTLFVLYWRACRSEGFVFMDLF